MSSDHLSFRPEVLASNCKRCFAKTSLEGRLSIQGLPFGPSNKTVLSVIYVFRGQARMFVVNKRLLTSLDLVFMGGTTFNEALGKCWTRP
jgi:hypothetical protein